MHDLSKEGRIKLKSILSRKLFFVVISVSIVGLTARVADCKPIRGRTGAKDFNTTNRKEVRKAGSSREAGNGTIAMYRRAKPKSKIQ